MSCCIGFAAAVSASGDADPLDKARSFHRARQWSEALAAYRAVIGESTDPAAVAVAHSNTCQILREIADPTAALGHCEKALELRRELGDEVGAARTLSNLGLVLGHLGRYEEAESAHLEALRINEQIGDVSRQVANRLNLGVLAMKVGRYGDAMRYHTSAESIATDYAQEPWSMRQIHIAWLNQCAVLEKLGAYHEALELHLDLVGQMEGADVVLRARAAANLGVVYRNLGDPIRAVEWLDKAAQTYAGIGDVAGLSNVELNLGLVFHLNLGRLEEAEHAFRKALELARRSGDRSEEIQDLFYLGNLQLDFGRLASAEELYEETLELAGQSGSTEGRWSGLYGLGRIAELRGRLQAALDHYRRAIEEIESVRSGLAEASWRSGFFGDKRPVYAAAVDVLSRLHSGAPEAGHDDEALEIVQRAKARELLEALGDVHRAARPLDAEALRRLPRRGEVWLEYFHSEHDLFVWILRRGGLRMVKLGGVDTIFDQVRQVHEALAADRRPDAETVRELSRTLLVDAAALKEAGRLRVAPDGQLFYLPFEILLDFDEPGTRLLDRRIVTYLPSASTPAMLERRREESARPRQVRLVGFADPELPFDPARPREPASLQVSRYGLEALPAARRELETVGGILGGAQDLRVGIDATEAAFRQAVAEGGRVVHLATHAVVDERPGQGARIVLAAGGGHDGLLSPEEISELDLRSGLTVLAACRTALGEIEGGRALSSLTGSFLAAGSSSVVATLWEIDDAGSEVFMEQFYYQLSTGRSADEALRRAKLELSRDPTWNRPGLWSAYVLIGEGRPVIDRPLVPAWALVTAGLLSVAALGLVFVRRAPDISRRSRARRP